MLSILVVLVLSINFTSAITGSIGNARMILRPEIEGGLFSSTTIDKSILVKNVNNEKIKIKLEVDEGAKDFLELIIGELIIVICEASI